jgi:hypothetical protein
MTVVNKSAPRTHPNDKLCYIPKSGISRDHTRTGSRRSRCLGGVAEVRPYETGWDPACSSRGCGGGGGGGGGCALPALVLSCVGDVCRQAINLLYYCKVLLGYCFWIVVHSSLIIMLLLKLLYLILSLIIFPFIMKNSTPPCTPSGQG